MDTPTTGGATTQVRSGVVVVQARPEHCDRDTDPPAGDPQTLVHGLLLSLAIGAAWLPIETRSWVTVAIAAVVLVLIPWGWQRTAEPTVVRVCVGTAVFILLACSAVSGWDPSRAVGVIGLTVAVAAMVWLASRSRPPGIFPALLAFGIAGLAVWGIWQVWTGLEAIRPGIDELSSPARAYAEERVASRRAFASLPLPSHLAVLLATALPLLLARIRATPKGMIWLGSAALAVAGLAVTKSPVGIGLALVAVVPVLLTRHRAATLVIAGGLVVVFISVVVIRPDVTSFEPVSLRLDNWRTAVWLTTTSPASGIGVASFAQASQANPLAVGNRPAHAHSLPFEALAEFGPAGVLACLLFGYGLLHLMRGLWDRHRALAAAIAVIPLHNLVDFSFFVSGVALPWAVLVGWSMAIRKPEQAFSDRMVLRGRILVVVAAACVLAVTILHTTSIVVEQAAAASNESQVRFDGALRSIHLAPWRIESQFLLASAAIESRNRLMQDRAWNEVDRLRWYRPRSAALAERRARLALARGDVSAALAEMWSVAEFGGPRTDTGSELGLNELISTFEKVDDDPPG